MFTGIVQAVGSIRALKPQGSDLRLEIDAGSFPRDKIQTGGSIAVNGCCLTVIEGHTCGFSADASRETLTLTTLGNLAAGSPVNLESSLTLATPLGGHLVLGHVDGIGTIVERHEDARSVRFGIEVPQKLGRYIARKGSVCVDGVSLTVNSAEDETFGVNIIPYTLEHTILKNWRQGVRVNLEVDLLARYLERLLQRDTVTGDSA